MPRRYKRTQIEVFQTRDRSVPDFPGGEGPPIFLTVEHQGWIRLGLGEGAKVPFNGEKGGAFAWGLTTTLVAVWIHSPAGKAESAYCQHLSPGPLNPVVHQHACREIGFSREDDPNRLVVLLAGQREVTADDERAFLQLGVLPHHLFTYSHALLPQFGVSHKGCAGEAG